MIERNAQFVDLAAMSMSGSLLPAVPSQIMIKHNPPTITIVYHFAQRKNQQFFHEIAIDRHSLVKDTVDDIVSHLYVTEAYYLNPKLVVRSQLARLVTMLQQGSDG